MVLVIFLSEYTSYAHSKDYAPQSKISCTNSDQIVTQFSNLTYSRFTNGNGGDSRLYARDSTIIVPHLKSENCRIFLHTALSFASPFSSDNQSPLPPIWTGVEAVVVTSATATRPDSLYRGFDGGGSYPPVLVIGFDFSTTF